MAVERGGREERDEGIGEYSARGDWEEEACEPIGGRRLGFSPHDPRPATRRGTNQPPSRSGRRAGPTVRGA
jgi:hypothetical protein